MRREGQESGVLRLVPPALFGTDHGHLISGMGAKRGQWHLLTPGAAELPLTVLGRAKVGCCGETQVRGRVELGKPSSPPASVRHNRNREAHPLGPHCR